MKVRHNNQVSLSLDICCCIAIWTERNTYSGRPTYPAFFDIIIHRLKISII